jgi:hypothetical protein
MQGFFLPFFKLIMHFLSTLLILMTFSFTEAANIEKALQARGRTATLVI